MSAPDIVVMLHEWCEEDHAGHDNCIHCVAANEIERLRDFAQATEESLVKSQLRGPVSARDDYPWQASVYGQQIWPLNTWRDMCDEIDRLRDDESAIAWRDRYIELLQTLRERVEAERHQARSRKQAAAASHSTGNYDRMLGYEAALEWCADLLREVGQ